MSLNINLCIASAAVFFSTLATAGVIYDEKTGYLSIPTVQVGDTQYNFLVIKIDAATLVSYGSSSKASGPGAVARTCAKANLTQAHFDAIKVGMTLDEVNTLLGCQYTPRVKTWADENINPGVLPRNDIWFWQAMDDISSIQVGFDTEGKKVVGFNDSGTDAFKTATFLQP